MGIFGDSELKKLKRVLYDGGVAVAVSPAMPASNVAFMLQGVEADILQAARKMASVGRRQEVEGLIEAARRSGGGSNPSWEGEDTEALWNQLLDDVAAGIGS